MTGCGALYREEQAARLNKWLGKHKDERVKTIGLPDRCAVLSSGEETCEWIKRGITWEHRMVFTFDKDGIAQQWSYNGHNGSFTSADYPVAGDKR
jgi:hypothetical protein